MNVSFWDVFWSWFVWNVAAPLAWLLIIVVFFGGIFFYLDYTSEQRKRSRGP